MLAGFLDELEKIAAAHGQLRRPKERRGRRPMTVTTLLRKEKDGTLYKGGYVADTRAAGADDPKAAVPVRRPGDVPSKGPNVEAEKTGQLVSKPTLRPYQPGASAPSKPNEPDRVDLKDRRAEASVQPSGPNQTLSDIGARNDHY